jgi:hypothetical protein
VSSHADRANGPPTTAGDCVFAKALLAGEACCALAQRHDLGERTGMACGSAVALTNCTTLRRLLHERARFALRLLAEGRPVTHLQMLRLQCGGVAALRRQLDEAAPDVHELVARAQARHGSLTELPWEPIVRTLAAWQPRRRSVPR